MKLDRVTLTGADDTVEPQDLIDLSAPFGFAEWGILVSQKRSGSPRFPSLEWVEELQRLKRAQVGVAPIRLSLHVCGSWVRTLLNGGVGFANLLEGFERVQLNFHGETPAFDHALMLAVLPSLGKRQIIFQIDGAEGGAHLDAVWDRDQEGDIDAVPLHDLSHGAGFLPGSWPAPLGRDVYNGYAGGLGPDNVVDQIDAIAKVVGGARVWIDMETKVRSANGFEFDLKKCRRVLESCDPFVAREPTPHVALNPAAAWPFPDRKPSDAAA